MKRDDGKLHKAIRVRLYPTQEQRVFFAKSFGCRRKIWNLMLADKIAYYKENGKMLHNTPAQYKAEYPYLAEVDSLALANVQIDLETAFSAFFSQPRVGFPKFKSAKHCRRSYSTNNQNGTVAVTDGCVRLPKVGLVKAKIHRTPASYWVLKGATISQESDGSYYASLEYITGEKPERHIGDKAIGLDYKSDGLFMDSNGNLGTNHKFFRESQYKLAKAQRKLSRCKGSGKGEEKSHNYLKQLEKVNKIQCHIANQRKDNLHKISCQIANEYDIVCVENLNLKGISSRKKKHKKVCTRRMKLGKATMDNGYGTLLDMLAYKLADRGKILVKVDRFFPSSQLCSHCGYQNKAVKNMDVREWTCPECGAVHNRDINAAVNILNEGLRVLKTG